MCIDSYADISIHTPTRGTTAGTGTATNLAEFQSTFPREERPYYTIVRIQVLQFQSTLPREERPFPTDFVTAFMPYFNPRSHERSDLVKVGDQYKLNISIHAPTRGATVFRRAERNSCRISIHAPTRGATNNGRLCGAFYVFQSTLPREERREAYIGMPIVMQFQSTLPREERPISLNVSWYFKNFNPRSHERSDITIYISSKRISISIHAPTRGAT